MYDFSVSDDGAKIAVACYGKHTVRVYNIADMTLLYTIGIPGSAGDVTDGKLNYPTSVEFVGNSLYVATYRGGPINVGGIHEFSAVDGTFVTTLLEYGTSGNTWDNEVYLPKRIQYIGDKFYVSNGKEDVGVFASDWTHITTYSKPTTVALGSINPYGVSVDEVNNTISILCNSFAGIVTLGIDDHDVKMATGHMFWADRADIEPEQNGMYNPHCIADYDENYFVAADTGNNRVAFITKQPMLPIQYDIPQNAEVIYASKELTGNTAIVPVQELKESELHLVYKEL